MHGLYVGQDSDNQPSSSCCLPLGDASSDIIGDMMIASPHRPVCDLRRFPNCFYIIGSGVGSIITELGEMKSFNNLSKTDEVFSTTEVEDLEALARMLMKATS